MMQSGNSLQYIHSLLSRNIVKPSAIDSILSTLQLCEEHRSLSKQLLLHKHRNFQILNNHNYRIISLGTQCLPNTIATRWGLKPSISMGETRKPFDLAVHPFSIMHGLVMNSFQEYRCDSIVDHGGQRIFANAEHGILFTHDIVDGWDEESGDLKTKPDAGELIDSFNETLRGRVAAFNAAAGEGDNLFIVCFGVEETEQLCGEEQHSYLEKYESILHRLKEFSATNMLACIALTRNPELTLPQEIRHSHMYLMPDEEYKWAVPDSWFSARGLQLECGVADYIASIITSNMRKLQHARHDESVYDLYKSSASLARLQQMNGT